MPERFGSLENLSVMEKNSLLEGHIGAIIGLVTVIYQSEVCPDLLAESETNLLGSFFTRIEDEKFIHTDRCMIGLANDLFDNFDPSKITCQRLQQQVQFTAKLYSQMKMFMSFAGLKVILRLFKKKLQ